MATVFQPIVNELNTVLVQLRIASRGLQTDANGVGIAMPVMQTDPKRTAHVPDDAIISNDESEEERTVNIPVCGGMHLDA